MSLTTFTTQRQLMTKGMPKMDSSNNMMLQQQKIMLYAFPVIFAITGVNFPVGVLIYWSTTNLWTWGQQYYVIKRNPTPGSPAYEELQRKRNKKNGVVESDETQMRTLKAQRSKKKVSASSQKRRKRRSRSRQNGLITTIPTKGASWQKRKSETVEVVAEEAGRGKKGT